MMITAAAMPTYSATGVGAAGGVGALVGETLTTAEGVGVGVTAVVDVGVGVGAEVGAVVGETTADGAA